MRAEADPRLLISPAVSGLRMCRGLWIKFMREIPSGECGDGFKSESASILDVHDLRLTSSHCAAFRLPRDLDVAAASDVRFIRRAGVIRRTDKRSPSDLRTQLRRARQTKERPMHTKRRASLTALVGILALAGAACGSDSDNDSASTSQGSSSSQSRIRHRHRHPRPHRRGHVGHPRRRHRRRPEGPRRRHRPLGQRHLRGLHLHHHLPDHLGIRRDPQRPEPSSPATSWARSTTRAAASP